MKQRILIYHGKHGDEYYLADTNARLAAAKQQIFQMLDEWGCYSDIDDERLTAARGGDHGAIHSILIEHQDSEYENWEIVIATDATSDN